MDYTSPITGESFQVQGLLFPQSCINGGKEAGTTSGSYWVKALHIFHCP